MKKLFLTISIACVCACVYAQNYYKEYSAQTEIRLSANQLYNVWECTINGDSIVIPNANYNFANDYGHLQMADSISYTYDSWYYIEDDEIIIGSGAPLNVAILGWSENGNILLGDNQGTGSLNGYYNGIELKTWSVENTTIKNLVFTLVSYGTAIQEVITTDGIKTYILTGDCNNLPSEMYEDLITLINETTDIRFDIHKMRNPKNFGLANVINRSDAEQHNICIVGATLYNEIQSGNGSTNLSYETSYEVVDESAPEVKPLLCDGEDFHTDVPIYADSITFSRILSVNADSTKNMNSLILPFDIDAQYLTNIDAIPYTVSSISSTTIKTRKITGTIPANTPFIIKRTANPKDTVLNIKVYDVMIPETPGNLQNGYLVGVYEKMYVPVGCKVISKSTFKTVSTNQTLCSAFRAFVVPNGEDYYTTYKATTSLFGIEAEEEETIELINLLGERVSQPARGTIYIHNGKKQMVR